MRSVLCLAALTLLGACAPVTAGSPPAPTPDFAAIEQRLGGRVGVALVGADGRLRYGHRTGERFAMCSTFKHVLAGLVLKQAEQGRLSLEESIAFGRHDLVSHAPVVSANLAKGHLTIAELAEAIVTVSDNSAANLLLKRVGGPAAVTAFVRSQGDAVTRLDRMELALNENALGDPRDTSSPAAMARLTRDLVLGDVLDPPSRQRLAGWLEDSRTGLERIRAGMPQGWRVGDKTGNCGNAYNDVAIVWPAGAEPFVLAVYLDRPTAEESAINPAIAEIGALSAARID